MITQRELGWAAGFIEGEGCFTYGEHTPRIMVGQKDRQPLEQLARMFGGNIHLRQVKYKGGLNPIHHWSLTGTSAIEVMQTLYTLMSPRRQAKIREGIVRWKKAPGAGVGSLYRWCRKAGHEFTPDNVMMDGYARRCKTCRREYNRKYKTESRGHANEVE